MVPIMNNQDVEASLDECQNDLIKVKAIIDSLGPASNIVPYLTMYAVIKACGTIEVAFKAVIADHCSRRSKKQVKNFLDNRIRDSSYNPKYDLICKILMDFDEYWERQFKAQLSLRPDAAALRTSLTSLVDARNDFAHGGNPVVTIADVAMYFAHARCVIEVLDQVVT